jgi:hypothetical protein
MITKEQFQRAAVLIGCKISRIIAVYNVETSGKGYLTDGRIKILFEGHKFWSNIKKAGGDPSKIADKYSNVVYPKWDKSKYMGGSYEWERMSDAIAACKELGIPEEAALDSASYGSFQILGSNAEACGYKSAQEMIAYFNAGGEAEQLMAFVRFIKHERMDKPLIEGEWQLFADMYNGPESKKNKYAEKLKAEEDKYLRTIQVNIKG